MQSNGLQYELWRKTYFQNICSFSVRRLNVHNRARKTEKFQLAFVYFTAVNFYQLHLSHCYSLSNKISTTSVLGYKANLLHSISGQYRWPVLQCIVITDHCHHYRHHDLGTSVTSMNWIFSRSHKSMHSLVYPPHMQFVHI